MEGHGAAHRWLGFNRGWGRWELCPGPTAMGSLAERCRSVGREEKLRNVTVALTWRWQVL